MGQEYSAICDACDARFTVSDGGGFTFHLLRCDRCGGGSAIPSDEIGEPHLRYLKGLSVPYSMATAEHDRHIRETYPGEPMARGKHDVAVAELCGDCECGRRFRFDAPARCPRCRSTELRSDRDGGFASCRWAYRGQPRDQETQAQPWRGVRQPRRHAGLSGPRWVQHRRHTRRPQHSR